jgi:site-specific DNA-cytosine methylase
MTIETVTAIDLFSGGGGFTTGATQAGVRVVWAAIREAEA